MATAPYGCISKPMRIFAVMLSYSAAFQAWVEEADTDIPVSGDTRAAFCLDYIHLGLYTKPAGGWVYPAAVIEVPDDVSFSTIAQSADGPDFDTGAGMFDCTIVRPVPSALQDDKAAAWLDFAGVDTDGTKTGIGPIISDLLSLPETVEKFQEYSIALADGPYFAAEEKRVADGLRMVARIRVQWGFQ